MDNLARLVGASANKSEWWTRPFTLNSWGEDAFVTKLHGVYAVKRARTESRADAVTVSCNTEVGEISSTQTTRQLNKISAKLPALHPPQRLSSEGSVLTSLGNFTKIIAKNAETFGKKPGEIFQTNSYHRPPSEYNYDQKFYWQNTLLTIW